MFDYNDSEYIYELMMKAKEIRKNYFNMSYTSSRRYDIIKFIEKSKSINYEPYYDDTLVFGKFIKDDISTISVNYNQTMNTIFTAAYMLVCLDDSKKTREETTVPTPLFKTEEEIRNGLIASYILEPQEVLANDIHKCLDEDNIDLRDIKLFSFGTYTSEDVLEIRLKAEGYLSDDSYKDDYGIDDTKDPEDDWDENY